MAYRCKPDAARTWMYVSPGCAALTGFSVAELLGGTRLGLVALIHPADREAVWAEVERAVAERREFETHYRLVAADGDERWVRDRGMGVWSKSGDLDLIEGFITDLPEWERHDEDGRKTEALYRHAFQVNPDSIVFVDVETSRIVEVNEGFERTFGWTRGEAVGRTTLSLDLWQSREDRDHFYQVFREQGRVHEFRAIARHRDGVLRHVVMSVERTTVAGCDYLCVVGRDVTERAKAEGALRKSEEKFAKAFHASLHSLIISDLATGCFLEVNAGFEQIYGYNREEAIGRTAIELGLWPDPELRAAVAAQVKVNGSVRNLELPFLAKGGRKILVLLSLESIEIAGVPCVLASGTDVTAQRQAAEDRERLECQLRQAQKLDALGQLAGGIAHDFNNVLAGILANTELAMMDVEKPHQVRTYLGEVTRAGERARDLVRRILTFSRQQPNEREACRLSEVVHEALRLLRASLPRTLELVEMIDPHAPIVLADPSQIHQVVLNLGINAAQAMRAAPQRLTVALERVEVAPGQSGVPRTVGAGVYARLTVSDTGCGMEESTLTRIFEPFFTTKGPGQGTGLGLAVVHGIVESHDGVIKATSRPGEGTTFTIYLPEYDLLLVDPPHGDAAWPLGQGERILVVDDEEMVGRSLAGLLDRFGYRTTFFSDPVAAWAAYAQAEFDLVLSDVTMPGLSGVELARRMVNLRPGIPVLLASGYAGGWTNEEVRALGARGLLAKPLSAESVARAVHEALQPEATPAAGDSSSVL